jgi:hypothetical protein
MGRAGYVDGANALIDMLRDGDLVPKEEIVWALEAISGLALGDDIQQCAAWWQSLPAQSMPEPAHPGDLQNNSITNRIP